MVRSGSIWRERNQSFAKLKLAGKSLSADARIRASSPCIARKKEFRPEIFKIILLFFNNLKGAIQDDS